MQCKLCNRQSLEDQFFCSYHRLARERLKQAFGRWQEAYRTEVQELSWQNYLEKLVHLQETGQWAKEVAELELKDLKGVEKKYGS